MRDEEKPEGMPEIPHSPKEASQPGTRQPMPLRPQALGGCGPPDEFAENPLKPTTGLNGPPAEDGTPGEEAWEDSAELASGEASPQEMATYETMVRRLEWMIVVAGAVVAASVAWPLGRIVAACLLLGTALAWINFHWLAASVNAIGERIVEHESGERGGAIVARGVGRIFLIALFAYVIFRLSERGLVGFLAGLTMPAIAMMCEAVYEFAASNRRPS